MKTKILLAVLALFNLVLFRAEAQVTVATVPTSGLAEPYGVITDDDGNIYLSDSANNQIVIIDAGTQALSTLAGIPSDPAGSNDGPAYLAHLNNPEGLLLVTYNGIPGLLVSDSGNNLIRFVRLSDGYVTTLAGQLAGGPAVNAPGTSATFRYPAGLAQDENGNIYIADFGNGAIRVMNLSDPNLNVYTVAVNGTTLFKPTAVAVVSTNKLWVADTGNQMVKLFTLTTPTSADLTTALGAYRTAGTADASFGANARFNGPRGLLWLQGTGLLISDTDNNSIRLATNYAAFGANNYAVNTFAGTPGHPGLVDGNALSAKLNSPVGLVQEIANNGFLVADLKNNAIRRIQLGPVQPPVPAPQIGWVDFTVPPATIVSILRPGPSFVFNNDVTIAILDTDGTETHYTSGVTPSNPLNDTIPDPSAIVGSTPPNYFDGMFPEQVPPSIVLPQPDVTIKAIGFQSGRKSSSIVRSRFQFKAAGPNIQGDNAASFKVLEETIGAELWYTTDGSDPTNAPPSIGPIAANNTSGVNLSINASTNFIFKVRAFRNNYQPSEVVSQAFSTTNFNANKITFGFASGEASSDFIASPGQFFYAPVTMNILAGVQIYSLQFNVTVTNSPATIHQVDAGAVGFTSALMQQVSAIDGDHLPPAASQWYATIPPAMCDDTLSLRSLMFTNSLRGDNLLGIGWIERWGFRCLYNSGLQDLISFSIAHDTLFPKASGRVVLGSYGFRVPLSATAGEQYSIRLNLPSATSDGVGAPGSAVYIETPTNGSLASGAINSFKDVTVGQRKYVAGDVYPFRWFNAGDFGNGALENADVLQVFQSAIYGVDNPPDGSDLFDGMDSCGYLYTTDPSTGLLIPDVNPANAAAIFDGNDTTINQIAFGDGVLDICDVFVTFRRSLDTNLFRFQRFWTNGLRVADMIPGNATVNQTSALHPLTNLPSVLFASADLIASAGQTVQVPITAKILGNYPLKVLGLNLSVKPLDGSPAPTSAIQFTPSGGVGQPSLAAAKGNANYTAAWLNNTGPGLTSNAVLGTLTFQVPANASSNSAYAIHFDRASASPNGLASFPKKTTTGLITLSDRSASTFNDGIPDSWRLRYFGTVNNALSQANADADGDGANNMAEFIAGTDPTDATSKLKVSADRRAAVQPQDCVIRWPSVAGKRYVIQRSTSIFSPAWIPVSTNTGTGSDMEFHDTAGGSVRFYRVSVE